METKKLKLKSLSKLLFLTFMSFIFCSYAQKDTCYYNYVKGEIHILKNKKSYTYNIPYFKSKPVINIYNYDNYLYIAGCTLADKWVSSYYLKKVLIKKDSLVQISEFYTKCDNQSYFDFNLKKDTAVFKYDLNNNLISIKLQLSKINTQEKFDKITKSIKTLINTYNELKKSD